MKLAVQLYSLRDDYKTGEEFLKILEKVKEIGFEGVEFAGFGGCEPEVIKAKLDELGLTAVGCHMGVENFSPENIEETIRIAKVLGMKNIGTGGAPHETDEEVQALVDIYSYANKIGEKDGIRFYYHNHTEEFEIKFGDRLCMNRIADGAYLELDTYWSYCGGADNYTYIKDNADKIILLHIKDGINRKPTALGEGDNDLLSVFKAAKEIDMEWLVLENDDPVPTGIEDITRSMKYFKENL
ncbi:MAG: sugar phosphate isomerase/epimerase [Clostridia bacterium]|nr:sugar phosphate isomerase/epimerase [Clostridia bacterium]